MCILHLKLTVLLCKESEQLIKLATQFSMSSNTSCFYKVNLTDNFVQHWTRNPNYRTCQFIYCLTFSQYILNNCLTFASFTYFVPFLPMEVDLFCVDMVTDFTILRHMTYNTILLQPLLSVILDLVNCCHHSCVRFVTEQIVAST